MLLLGILLISVRFIDCLTLCDPPNSLVRVIGGSTAPIGNYPWQAAVVFYDGSEQAMMCGATIVDDRWVLTAAHCVMNTWKTAFILTGLGTVTDPRHTVHVEEAVIHPDYDENEIINDIALVKSKKSLLRRGVTAVCFTRDDTRLLASADTAIVLGFGLHIVSRTGDELTMGVSDVILGTTLPIIPRRQCQSEWSILSGGTMRITDRQICAGSLLHGTAPGDSGGPLLVKDPLGRLVQVGVTSYGAGGVQGLLDQSTYPGVYTRVSPYIPWMELVTNSASVSLELIAFLGLFIFCSCEG
ncbi:hypothetical protein Q1695_005765 [Nippostrongylus brasiliensis]|nr:hypothetical protein Q1695_005765 [Nippostrongylus brasiliensis]